METRAAVLFEPGGSWQVVPLDLDPPRAGEVLVEFAYAGMCHSDEHLRRGNGERLPMIGGHEGAGRVLEVGPGVDRLTAGDHVVSLPVPACGHCGFCASGRASLCARHDRAATGQLPDGSYRFRHEGRDVGATCVLGTFAHHAVVAADSLVGVPDDVPLEVAALISCGVMTGWGAVVNTAHVRPGDTVVVFGAGGIGLNAIQAAAVSGAAHVIAVEPNNARHELAARLGATHVVTGLADAVDLARQMSPHGTGADHTVISVGDVDAEVTRAAFDATGKGGSVVITSLSHSFDTESIRLRGTDLVLTERRIVGSSMGSCNPAYDVPRLVSLYRSGRITLDPLVTRRYPLTEINSGYDDLLSGVNARGIIDHAI